MSHETKLFFRPLNEIEKRLYDLEDETAIDVSGEDPHSNAGNFVGNNTKNNLAPSTEDWRIILHENSATIIIPES